MAKNKNTFEKRRKEIEKKRKADEKRERRHARNKRGDEPEQAVRGAQVERLVGDPGVELVGGDDRHIGGHRQCHIVTMSLCFTDCESQ